MSATTPSGLAEELALERAAIAEHERRAAELWSARRYEAARDHMARAAEARAQVRKLEQIINDDDNKEEA